MIWQDAYERGVHDGVLASLAEGPVDLRSPRPTRPDAQVVPVGERLRCHRRDHFAREVRDPHRLHPERLRLDARQQQQLIDQPRQPVAGVDHLVERGRHARRLLAVTGNLRLRAQCRQRIAQLVGGVGREATLLFE